MGKRLACGNLRSSNCGHKCCMATNHIIIESSTLLYKEEWSLLMAIACVVPLYQHVDTWRLAYTFEKLKDTRVVSKAGTSGIQIYNAGYRNAELTRQAFLPPFITQISIAICYYTLIPNAHARNQSNNGCKNVVHSLSHIYYHIIIKLMYFVAFKKQSPETVPRVVWRSCYRKNICCYHVSVLYG